MSSPKRLLFFCSFPFYPAKSGLDRRCLELLEAIRELGFEITVCSVFNPKGQERLHQKSFIALREAGHVAGVEVYAYKLWDRAYLKAKTLLFRRRGLFETLNPVTPSLHRWFQKLVKKVKPDVALVVFANWGQLLEQLPNKKIVTVIEMIDLLTLNSKMWAAAQGQVDRNEELSEGFYEEAKLKADSEEMRMYDQVDYTIAISASEAEEVIRETTRTKVLLAPMTIKARPVDNTYAGSALFLMGPNPFNVQGALLFIQTILPLVRERVPDFNLSITGNCESLPSNIAGVTLLGFVADLDEIWRDARFLVCPVYGGTGQLVKVVESMAHAIPPIIFKSSQHRAPVEHGVDGLIANDAAHFAELTINLWLQRDLCQKLGMNARDKIYKKFDTSQLAANLKPIAAGKPCIPK